MTKDTFRSFQKIECKNGGSRHDIYGCPCCRKIKNLNSFKKFARRKAKSRLRNMDVRLTPTVMV